MALFQLLSPLFQLSTSLPPFNWQFRLLNISLSLSPFPTIWCRNYFKILVLHLSKFNQVTMKNNLFVKERKSYLLLTLNSDSSWPIWMCNLSCNEKVSESSERLQCETFGYILLHVGIITSHGWIYHPDNITFFFPILLLFLFYSGRPKIPFHCIS